MTRAQALALQLADEFIRDLEANFTADSVIVGTEKLRQTMADCSLEVHRRLVDDVYSDPPRRAARHA